MTHTRLVALVLTSAALTASGCGSSTKTTSNTSAQTPSQVSSQTTTTAPQTTVPPISKPAAQTTPLTHAQFVSRADAICAQTIAKRSQLYARSQNEFAAVVPVLAAYQRTLYAELGTLVPPKSLAGDWEQVLRSTRVLAEATTKIGTYGQNNRSKSAQPFYNQFDQARSRLRAASARAGMRSCARY